MFTNITKYLRLLSTNILYTHTSDKRHWMYSKVILVSFVTRFTACQENYTDLATPFDTGGGGDDVNLRDSAADD